MKSLNGLLFIVGGGLIIWIGATGRLPALAAALGMIKNSPGNAPNAPKGSVPYYLAANPNAASTANPPASSHGSSDTYSIDPVVGMKNAGTNFWNNTVGPYATVLGLK
jgi:hypothetical protein